MKWGLPAMLVFSALLSWYLAQDRNPVVPAPKAESLALIADDPLQTVTAAIVEDEAEPAAQPMEVADFMQELRARFGPHLHIAHARIKAIEQVLAYLQQQYPDDWEGRVAPFLWDAFPDAAEAMLANYQSLSDYNNYLRANRGTLTAMLPADRKRALWEAREQAFGEQAKEIWAAEIRNQGLQDTLASLEDAAHLQVGEKLQVFLKSVNDHYGEQATGLLQQRRSELLNRFLEVDAVQAELRQMPVPQRSAALRDLRQGMGMDAEALSRWDALDQSRDQAWQQGREYNERRAQLLAEQAAGDERENALQALREQYFGEAAAMVAAEEAGGFLRYGRERRIGRE